MRVCAQVALISASGSACFGLAGCAAIDELRDTFLRWAESEKLPSERGVFAPDATPVVPPEKPAKKEASRTSKKQDKSARKPQRPQSVVLPPKKPSISRIPPRPADENEGQSAPPASSDCALLFRKRRRREFFHAEIGHRRWMKTGPTVV